MVCRKSFSSLLIILANLVNSSWASVIDFYFWLLFPRKDIQGHRRGENGEPGSCPRRLRWPTLHLTNPSRLWNLRNSNPPLSVREQTAPDMSNDDEKPTLPSRSSPARSVSNLQIPIRRPQMCKVFRHVSSSIQLDDDIINQTIRAWDHLGVVVVCF